VMQAMNADAGFAGVEKEQRLKPHVEWYMRTLQHRPDLYIEGLAAGVALVGADLGRLPTQPSDTLVALAMWTYGPVGPDLALYKSVSCFLTSEGRLV